MKEISAKLISIISTCLPELRKMNDDTTSVKKTQDQWSKKEILGHLIDSCSNNHQRIVRALHNVADQFPLYNQNEWVRVQKYNEMRWNDLLEFWAAYNIHLSIIIKKTPDSAGSAACNIGQEELATLEFVVTDYIRHLQHHLDRIL